MRDKIDLNGIVLSSMPVGDYDKRLVLLTKERGKITAFARGARKPNSPYLGLSEPFNFGTFSLMEGFDAYRLVGGEVKEYFLDVKNDIEGICYGTYFCDVMEYLNVDGIGDINMLNLLYVSLRALMNPAIPNALIRRIFELKVLAIDGEAMAAFSCVKCGEKMVTAFYLAGDGMVCDTCCAGTPQVKRLSQSAIYTIQYIISTSLDKLYTFQLTDDVFYEVDAVVERYFNKHVTKKFNSLEILSSLT
ncbi:MAG: DNA repair protein RecO [Lachnospiraceae bacterium]|nr:DNA repair protein RecO [Lachnospiraceae bacterium]HCJ06976.1 DNA repair protein RecO [Lachnospiraceae bacterium]